MGRDAARRRAKGERSGREPGSFVALPWSVLDSKAYRNLSANARALLLEVARQYKGDDNGRMLLSRAYLEPRGWKSFDLILKGKRELLENKLIHETAMGQRPAKAAWYAVTWQVLDRLDGFDAGAALLFVRGAYRDIGAKAGHAKRDTSAATAARKAAAKPRNVTPSHGAESARIAPSHGVERPPAAPSHGAISAKSAAVSTPSDGDPLEMPSAAPVPARRSQLSPATSTQGPESRRPRTTAPTSPGEQRIAAEALRVLAAIRDGAASANGVCAAVGGNRLRVLDHIGRMKGEGLLYDPRERGEVVSRGTTLRCTSVGLASLDRESRTLNQARA